VRETTLSARRRLYLLARVVVARHYRRQLTLAAVARALACSPRQLQRAYAQFGESTFSEDLHARRMAAAAQLLVEQPAVAVRDVARLVGYRQPSHFARVFRGRFGLPPARFRARARAHRAAVLAHGADGERAASGDQLVGRAADAAGSAASAGSEEIVSAAGRRTRTSVPPPGGASAVTLPPC
jgi:AraC family transcriptional regulator, regulatory protein of adaptative response / methylphosphotriester-DNA alkyltransferase methyltransferase